MQLRNSYGEALTVYFASLEEAILLKPYYNGYIFATLF